MAAVFTCERCGATAELVADDPLPKGWGRVRIWIPQSGQRDDIVDLCGQCVAGARKVLTTVPVTAGASVPVQQPGPTISSP